MNMFKKIFGGGSQENKEKPKFSLSRLREKLELGSAKTWKFLNQDVEPGEIGSKMLQIAFNKRVQSLFANAMLSFNSLSVPVDQIANFKPVEVIRTGNGNQVVLTSTTKTPDLKSIQDQLEKINLQPGDIVKVRTSDGEITWKGLGVSGDEKGDVNVKVLAEKVIDLTQKNPENEKRVGNNLMQKIGDFVISSASAAEPPLNNHANLNPGSQEKPIEQTAPKPAPEPVEIPVEPYKPPSTPAPVPEPVPVEIKVETYAPKPAPEPVEIPVEPYKPPSTPASVPEPVVTPPAPEPVVTPIETYAAEPAPEPVVTPPAPEPVVTPIETYAAEPGKTTAPKITPKPTTGEPPKGSTTPSNNSSTLGNDFEKPQQFENNFSNFNNETNKLTELNEIRLNINGTPTIITPTKNSTDPLTVPEKQLNIKTNPTAIGGDTGDADNQDNNIFTNVEIPHQNDDTNGQEESQSSNIEPQSFNLDLNNSDSTVANFGVGNPAPATKENTSFGDNNGIFNNGDINLETAEAPESTPNTPEPATQVPDEETTPEKVVVNPETTDIREVIPEPQQVPQLTPEQAHLILKYVRGHIDTLTPEIERIIGNTPDTNTGFYSEGSISSQEIGRIFEQVDTKGLPQKIKSLLVANLDTFEQALEKYNPQFSAIPGTGSNPASNSEPLLPSRHEVSNNPVEETNTTTEIEGGNKVFDQGESGEVTPVEETNGEEGNEVDPEGEVVGDGTNTVEFATNPLTRDEFPFQINLELANIVVNDDIKEPLENIETALKQPLPLFTRSDLDKISSLKPGDLEAIVGDDPNTHDEARNQNSFIVARLAELKKQNPETTQAEINAAVTKGTNDYLSVQLKDLIGKTKGLTTEQKNKFYQKVANLAQEGGSTRKVQELLVQIDSTVRQNQLQEQPLRIKRPIDVVKPVPLATELPKLNYIANMTGGWGELGPKITEHIIKQGTVPLELKNLASGQMSDEYQDHDILYGMTVEDWKTIFKNSPETAKAISEGQVTSNVDALYAQGESHVSLDLGSFLLGLLNGKISIGIKSTDEEKIAVASSSEIHSTLNPQINLEDINFSLNIDDNPSTQEIIVANTLPVKYIINENGIKQLQINIKRYGQPFATIEVNKPETIQALISGQVTGEEALKLMIDKGESNVKFSTGNTKKMYTAEDLLAVLNGDLYQNPDYLKDPSQNTISFSRVPFQLESTGQKIDPQINGVPVYKTIGEYKKYFGDLGGVANNSRVDKSISDPDALGLWLQVFNNANRQGQEDLLSSLTSFMYRHKEGTVNPSNIQQMLANNNDPTYQGLSSVVRGIYLIEDERVRNQFLQELKEGEVTEHTLNQIATLGIGDIDNTQTVLAAINEQILNTYEQYKKQIRRSPVPQGYNTANPTAQEAWFLLKRYLDQPKLRAELRRLEGKLKQGEVNTQQLETLLGLNPAPDPVSEEIPGGQRVTLYSYNTDPEKANERIEEALRIAEENKKETNTLFFFKIGEEINGAQVAKVLFTLQQQFSPFSFSYGTHHEKGSSGVIDNGSTVSLEDITNTSIALAMAQSEQINSTIASLMTNGDNNRVGFSFKESIEWIASKISEQAETRIVQGKTVFVYTVGNFEIVTEEEMSTEEVGKILRNIAINGKGIGEKLSTVTEFEPYSDILIADTYKEVFSDGDTLPLKEFKVAFAEQVGEKVVTQYDTKLNEIASVISQYEEYRINYQEFKAMSNDPNYQLITDVVQLGLPEDSQIIIGAKFGGDGYTIAGKFPNGFYILREDIPKFLNGEVVNINLKQCRGNYGAITMTKLVINSSAQTSFEIDNKPYSFSIGGKTTSGEISQFDQFLGAGFLIPKDKPPQNNTEKEPEPEQQNPEQPQQPPTANTPAPTGQTPGATPPGTTPNTPTAPPPTSGGVVPTQPTPPVTQPVIPNPNSVIPPINGANPVMPPTPPVTPPEIPGVTNFSTTPPPPFSDFLNQPPIPGAIPPGGG